MTSTRHAGAPSGNTNALKHGFYSSRFTVPDQDSLEDVATLDLSSEITLLRLYIARVVNLTPTDEDLDSARETLRLICLASTAISRLVRSQYLIYGQEGETISEYIGRIAEEVRLEMAAREDQDDDFISPPFREGLGVGCSQDSWEAPSPALSQGGALYGEAPSPDHRQGGALYGEAPSPDHRQGGALDGEAPSPDHRQGGALYGEAPSPDLSQGGAFDGVGSGVDDPDFHSPPSRPSKVPTVGGTPQSAALSQDSRKGSGLGSLDPHPEVPSPARTLDLPSPWTPGILPDPGPGLPRYALTNPPRSRHRPRKGAWYAYDPIEDMDRWWETD